MKHIDININKSTVALEAEQVDGKAQRELEYVIYGRLASFAVLSQATAVVHQVQSAMRGKKPGTQLRVRKVTDLDLRTKEPIGESQYVFTGKAPIDNGPLLEKNQSTDEEMFNIFLQANQEYVEKVRYDIPSKDVPGGNPWQVDTFTDKDGNQLDWVKIDLEIPSDTDWQLTPQMVPFDLQEMSIGFKGQIIHGSRESVNWFFDNVFNKKLG